MPANTPARTPLRPLALLLTGLTVVGATAVATPAAAAQGPTAGQPAVSKTPIARAKATALTRHVVTRAAGTTQTVYLSDLTALSQSNGWGPVEKDRSNGEQAAGDGRTLTLDGKTFAKGLGVHSTSVLRYTVPAGCSRFDAVVGIDDEVRLSAAVTFQVHVGTSRVYASGVRTQKSRNTTVSLPVTAGSELRLVVTDGGNGSTRDHADWADARLTCAPVTAPAPVAAPPPATAPVGTRDFGAATALWDPIPANPRLDATSAGVRTLLSASGASRVALLYAYGNKIYQADASTPRYQLDVLNAGYDKWGDNDLAHETVPIPDGAVPGTGTDGKIIVVDTHRRRVYDLWQVKQSGGTWSVSWGGIYDLDGDGSSRNPAYGTGTWGVEWPKPLSRGTGSGMSTLAGTVKLKEIEAGVIPHALVFASDSTCGPAQTGNFRWPATTTDGALTSGTCIPQGARIQLDPALDLAAIPGITKAELAIGRALQTYGAYATDRSDSRISIAFEAPKEGQADPYPAAGLAWDYFGLDRLPWSSVRMLASWNGA